MLLLRTKAQHGLVLSWNLKEITTVSQDTVTPSRKLRVRWLEFSRTDANYKAVTGPGSQQVKKLLIWRENEEIHLVVMNVKLWFSVCCSQVNHRLDDRNPQCLFGSRKAIVMSQSSFRLDRNVNLIIFVKWKYFCGLTTVDIPFFRIFTSNLFTFIDWSSFPPFYAFDVDIAFFRFTSLFSVINTHENYLTRISWVSRQHFPPILILLDCDTMNDAIDVKILIFNWNIFNISIDKSAC